MSYVHRTKCRFCKEDDLIRFLTLGNHPLADNFIDEAHIADEKKYPLDVYFCNSCSLVQLLDVVSQEELFHDAYANFSSASAPLVAHFKQFAEEVTKEYLKPDDFIVDIGSNDGALLQFFKEQRILGIEPAKGVADVARGKGIETWGEFFTEAVASRIRNERGEARLIMANNVFAHIDDIDSAMRGIKLLLAKDGIFIFEAHYLLDLIEHCEFDTICHEHLSYFTVKPLIQFFERFEMVVVDVQRVKSHGGSIRVVVKNAPTKVNPSVELLLELEAQAGLHSSERFARFQEEVETVRTKLVSLVRGFRGEGKKVVGYGAPAKSGTLLNYCGFTTKDLSYITDTTPHKVGLLTPGSHIPVVVPDILKSETPDYVLLLAWNYRDFILEKESELRSRGSHFIIPIPHPEVV